MPKFNIENIEKIKEELRTALAYGDPKGQNDFKKRVAENLKAARESTGFSQREVADILGMTAASLSSYEKGNTTPSLHVAICLAYIYEVSLDSICGTDNKNKLPETFSDVIKLLFLIQDTNGLDVHISYDENHFYNEGANAELIFKDRELLTFFADWEKMKTLYKEDSIDREVYELWIEKTLKKYDINIQGSHKSKILDEFSAIEDDDIPF